MASAEISGVAIRGLVTAVPANVRCVDDLVDLFGGNAATVERLKKTIGLDQRRVVGEGTTALDLAEAAARELLQGCDIDPSSIDGIFMVTQTPDYFQPGNAVLLQGRLGMGEQAAAMDFNLGCSGYVYGLWAVHSFIRSGGLKRVLLLSGDTISRIVSPRDRALLPLFGDAVSATLLEADPDAPEALFELCSDGRGYASLWQPGGAFREPLHDQEDAMQWLGEGVERSRKHLHMDGAEIFNFSLKVEPDAIRRMLAATGWTEADLDGIIFHQANRYIIDNIRRRLKLPAELVPSGTVERFGNQSSASIPATLNDHYGAALCQRPHRFILSGFGVGLSWATCAIQLPRLKHAAIIELPDVLDKIP